MRQSSIGSERGSLLFAAVMRIRRQLHKIGRIFPRSRHESLLSMIPPSARSQRCSLDRNANGSGREKMPPVVSMQVRRQIHRAGRSRCGSRQRRPSSALPLTARQLQLHPAEKIHLNGCLLKRRTPASRDSLHLYRISRPRHLCRASRSSCRSVDGRQRSNKRRFGAQAMALFRWSRAVGTRYLPLQRGVDMLRSVLFMDR